MTKARSMRSMGSHHRGYRGHSNEWLTPVSIIESLGRFDLDPCSPVNRPWATAQEHFTIQDDGLSLKWFGRIWMNPPYGPDTGKWLSRLADHGDGIALIFARTETDMFFRYGWERADAMLFLRGRLHFYSVAGERAKANAGAPSVLIAYGAANAESLRRCGPAGKYVELT